MELPSSMAAHWFTICRLLGRTVFFFVYRFNFVIVLYFCLVPSTPKPVRHFSRSVIEIQIKCPKGPFTLHSRTWLAQRHSNFILADLHGHLSPLSLFVNAFLNLNKPLISSKTPQQRQFIRRSFTHSLSKEYFTWWSTVSRNPVARSFLVFLRPLVYLENRSASPLWMIKGQQCV